MADELRPRSDRRILVHFPADALVVAAVCAAAAGALGLWGIGRASLTKGEAATEFAARMDLHHLAHLLRHVDVVHGAYYLLANAIVHAGGDIVAVRVVSVLATAACAALTALLAMRLGGSRTAGLAAGLAVAICPTLVADAKTGRSYALETLLVVVTAWCLVRAVDHRDGRSTLRWVAFTAALTVTAYVHELSVLLISAFAATLALVHASGAVWRRWGVGTVVALVLVSPLVVKSRREDRAVGWIDRPHLDAFTQTLHTYSGRSTLAAAVFGACALAGLVPAARPAGGVRGVVERWRARPDVSLVTLALPLAVLPPTVLIVESTVGHPLFDVRYVTYYQPGAALLFGAGVQRIGTALRDGVPGARAVPRSWFAGAVGAVAVTVLVVDQASVLHRLSTPLGYYQNYGAAAAFVTHRARAGDGVAYIPTSFHYIPDGYPAMTRLDDFAIGRTPLASGTFHGTPLPIARAMARMRGLHRIWAIGHPSLRTPSPLARHELALLHSAYRCAVRRYFNGVSVALYTRPARAA